MKKNHWTGTLLGKSGKENLFAVPAVLQCRAHLPSIMIDRPWQSLKLGSFLRTEKLYNSNVTLLLP